MILILFNNNFCFVRIYCKYAILNSIKNCIGLPGLYRLLQCNGRKINNFQNLKSKGEENDME